MFRIEAIPIDTRAVVTEESWHSLFSQVQKRAYRMACFDLGQTDLAWDMVQDAALTLMRRYANRPPEELVPLFYRILQNRIRDQHRRQTLERVLGFRSRRNEEDSDPLDQVAESSPTPERQSMDRELGKAIQVALVQLAPRQRQAFLLREWEGLSVEETATAMGCSAGSVKVHHFRALRRLRERLADWTPEGYFHES
ncbi:sigma-70 family RNA polymerase sigma factor [Acidithiobacillus sp. IBUN Pt1247-S3]|uniref:sigma-70 family RNA polymerase sigma factor n=1 Tax=Acidithiobacillus sp. IBUN Pt1247-S3 TaxID=3166642 RepID=UPI0034E53F9E